MPNEQLEIKISGKPGSVTIDKTGRIATAVINMLNAVAGDIAKEQGHAPDFCTFKLEEMHWIDDGIDEVTVLVKTGPKEDDDGGD